MKNLTLKDQGNLGEATAILYYAQRGCRVSKPLFENCPYDLIVDDGTLKRVQVKTSRCKTPGGRYQVNLRVFGGNRSGTGKVKKISADEVDVVFVLVEDGRTFELDAKALDGQSRVSVG
jgi:Tfp pilus assembly protein PilP